MYNINQGSNQDGRSGGDSRRGGYFSWLRKTEDRQQAQQSSNQNKMQKRWSLMNHMNIMSRFSSRELGCNHRGDRISVVGTTAK